MSKTIKISREQFLGNYLQLVDRSYKIVEKIYPGPCTELHKSNHSFSNLWYWGSLGLSPYLRRISSFLIFLSDLLSS